MICQYNLQLIPGGSALQLAGKLYLSLSALTDYCSWFVYNGLPLADCVQRFFVKLANWWIVDASRKIKNVTKTMTHTQTIENAYTKHMNWIKMNWNADLLMCYKFRKP